MMPSDSSSHAGVDPKAVLQRYLDALTAGDGDTIRDSFAPDATWSLQGDLPLTGPWVGRDAIVDDFLGQVGSLYESGSVAFEFADPISERDAVVLEWIVRARTAKGEPYHNRYCGVFEVRDGYIQTVREYTDTDYMARVLFGAEPPPPKRQSGSS